MPARTWIKVVALSATALALSGCLRFDVTVLSSDEFGGRNNLTEGSALSQEYLLGYLDAWTVPANPDNGEGLAGYQQPFAQGTNLVGIIPGTDLADEYVLVGGHYDGLGTSCRTVHPDDDICNGATDNAAGVAAVLQVARAIYYSPTPPRRSVVIAFWDAEEDGLRGARHFVSDPLVPLEDIVTYVNLDILGSNLRPSVRNLTFAIGAETGGSRLSEMTSEAASRSTLDTRLFSFIFGQNRSDHAPFVEAGVPAVFFGDSTGPCYHTNADDIDVVDFDKLERQTRVISRLVKDLATTASTPTFVADRPLATYDDLLTLHSISQGFVSSVDEEFTPEQATQIIALAATLDALVAAGRDAFSNDAMITTLTTAAALVSLATTGPCDGFLEDAAAA